MYTVLRIIHTIKHNLPEKKLIKSLNLWCYFTTFTHFYSPLDCVEIKSNQTLFSNLYTYKHVIHDETYILEKRMEKKLNNL